MIVLWDLDDTLMDWSGGYDADLDRNPALESVPRKEARKQWDLLHGLDEPTRTAVRDILNADDFYRRLKPLPGAVEAVQAVEDAGHCVFFCSTPWLSNPMSAAAKTHSVRDHFGGEMASRLILTYDKTLVNGHVLIDDKTSIRGLGRPHWTRVWFDQPWNRPDSEDLGRSSVQSAALRLFDMDVNKILKMLQWVDHIRKGSHEIPGVVDSQCDVCTNFWHETRP